MPLWLVAASLTFGLWLSPLGRFSEPDAIVRKCPSARDSVPSLVNALAHVHILQRASALAQPSRAPLYGARRADIHFSHQ